MADLPTGTITFLFTDIEGSTRLLQQLGPQFTPALERHHVLIREAVARHSGIEVKTEGDSFFCVFKTAADALAAAVAIQRSLAAEDWPDGSMVRVRIGVHTGVGALGGDDYIGMDVNRGARIAETGHGGQVVISAAARLLGESGLPDGVGFRDLGEFRLRDLIDPEHLYQLEIADIDSEFPPLRKLEGGPTNVTDATTGFVGREVERGEVRALLDESRLVTITGVAGAGKSRLALEVAAAARDSFPDGVWLVELAAVASEDLIAQEVAHVIGLQESLGRPATDVLFDYLRDGKRLLVLDNCEPMIEAVADLAAALIASTNDLKILATSQQVLDTVGETRYQCPPLTTPPLSADAASDLHGFDAAELFVARALEVDSTFAVTDANAAVIAAICRSLDGMPLAIELAAALIRVLTPEQILDRLADRFTLLTGGPRSAPQHQQTLQAALDSTFELLDEERQELAMRLGVFVGGFDVEAAESIAAGGEISRADVIAGLSALVDRSIISNVETVGGRRLGILESVRAYLLGKLKASGQLRVRQIAHARFFGEMITAAAAGLRGPEQDFWDARLEADIENVRAALSFTAEVGDDEGMQLVARMFLYWRSRGDWSDGLHWTRRALANASKRDSPLRARVLATAGFFASDLGYGASGAQELEDALAMARRTGDAHAIGYCSSFLGAELSRRDIDLDRGLALLADAQNVYAGLGATYGQAWVHRYLALSHQERGELDQAIELHQLSLDAFRAADDPWNIRFAQALLAEALHTVAELERSRELYDQSLRGSSETRYKVVIAHAYKGLGKVSLAEGNLEEATDHLDKALQELRRIGDVACAAETKGHLGMANLGRGHLEVAREYLLSSLRTFSGISDMGGVAWALERIAAVATESGAADRAAQLLSAGAAIRAQAGSLRPDVDQPDYERLAADLRSRMGDAAFNDAAKRGGELELAAAIRLGEEAASQ